MKQVHKEVAKQIWTVIPQNLECGNDNIKMFSIFKPSMKMPQKTIFFLTDNVLLNGDKMLKRRLGECIAFQLAFSNLYLLTASDNRQGTLFIEVFQ